VPDGSLELAEMLVALELAAGAGAARVMLAEGLAAPVDQMMTNRLAERSTGDRHRGDWGLRMTCPLKRQSGYG